MDLADVLEIERARARRHDREEQKTARMMAFLVTLMTGKPCKPEDLLKPAGQDAPQTKRQAEILEAYRKAIQTKKNLLTKKNSRKDQSA